MKNVYTLVFCIIFLCCREAAIASINAGTPGSPAPARDTLPGEVITVPVVIHILYNTDSQNIGDLQVLSQIESLNKDYRRLNNITNIPVAFAPLSADAKIVFCLAHTDPQGKATNGIIHKHTKTIAWSADDAMKFSASAGDNGWDSKKFLNIWVCNLTNKNLGYSSLPGSPVDKDGVVIQYDAFGTIGNLRHPFDKGRTATHEIGHWLGLLHLWGDALCGDDKIDDTPPQKTYNNGCPSFPHTSTCSVNANGDMFMDFMDFTDDACMSMFTHGQVKEMRSLFAFGNVRNSFLNSSVCNSPSPGVESKPAVVLNKAATPSSQTASVFLYPNPARDVINVESMNSNELPGQTCVMYNLLGVEVKRQLLTAAKNAILINDIQAGMYLVKIGEGKEVKIMQMVKR